MNIYHVFSRWRSRCTGPRKSTYDTRPSLGACIEGVVWGQDWSGTLIAHAKLKQSQLFEGGGIYEIDDALQN